LIDITSKKMESTEIWKYVIR